MTADPARLPDDLADLLDRTLGPRGVPGVLADWMDERSEFWKPLTDALRVARRPRKKPGGFHIGFRYRPAGPGVVFWAASVNHMSKWFGAPPEISRA